MIQRFTAFLLWGSVLAGCRDASVMPTTPLGQVASDWLWAHNRAEGHAAVHFAMTHQGSVRMTGVQVDSAVYQAVTFAKDVGPLTAVRLLESNDTSLVVLLHSQSSGDYRAHFTLATQPSTAQVVMRFDRLASGDQP